MKKSILQFCLMILLSAHLTMIAGSLPDINYKKTYRIAEDNFLNENYIAALPLYLTLDSLQKGNANINFKIGYCYLNSGGFKTLSIPYFVEAAKNVSKNYNKYSTKEIRAPQSTYSHLARAYQLDNNFDEAIVMYEKYKEMLGTSSNTAAEIEDINHDIETCKNGKEMIANPAHYTVTNLGEGVNSPYPDYSPVVSLDEQTLMFTSRRPEGTGGKKEPNGRYFEDIYISYFDNGKWEKAKSIGTNINTIDDEATVNLSADGQNLLIYKDDSGNGNIYLSEKKGFIWGLPQPLSANINTPYRETHACFSSDNKILYFVSDRPGGLGGLDIYKCLRLPNGKWASPQNLGPIINTRYDEDGVFIHPNGKEIFFSSKGNNSMGGFDIFSSKIDDENGFWTKPVNMGYPINSADDDIFFVVSADEKRAYFSSVKSGGFGEKDIYMIDFRENMPEALTLLKGFITLNGAAPLGGLSNVGIVATDVNSGLVVQNVKPVLSTGKYIMLLSSGIKGKTYNITCTAQGYEPINFLMTVPPDSSYQEIERSLQLQFVNFENHSIDTSKAISVVKDEKQIAIFEAKDVVKKNKTDLKNVSKTNYSLKNDTTVALEDLLSSSEINSKDIVSLIGAKRVLVHFSFDSNTSIYQKEFKLEFDKLLKLMREHPELIIEVGGHTDNVGREDDNIKLSKNRAQSIVNMLVQKGVPKNHFVVKGYGSSMPIAPNTLPNGKPDYKGMQLNRRVDLKIINIVQ